MEIELPVNIERQPNYTTCGPTSLHALYSYFEDNITLPQVISEVHQHEVGGGTVSVHLALHALHRGYEVGIWVSNTNYWDPTWFTGKVDLTAKLKARFAAKGWHQDRHVHALAAIEEYLSLGGKIVWGELSPQRISGVLEQGLPILAGTNGVYLYQCARETETGPDDIIGDVYGHFIVIRGYRSEDETASIADPLLDNPAYGTKYYRANIYRLIGAIFLGAATDDANCLVIKPKNWKYCP